MAAPYRRSRDAGAAAPLRAIPAHDRVGGGLMSQIMEHPLPLFARPRTGDPGEPTRAPPDILTGATAARNGHRVGHPVRPANLNGKP